MPTDSMNSGIAFELVRRSESCLAMRSNKKGRILHSLHYRLVKYHIAFRRIRNFPFWIEPDTYLKRYIFKVVLKFGRVKMGIEVDEVAFLDQSASPFGEDRPLHSDRGFSKLVSVLPDRRSAGPLADILLVAVNDTR